MQNKKKYIFSLVFILLITLFGVSYIFATETISDERTVDNIQEITSIDGIFDSKLVNGVYKTSDDANIYLPYIRYVADRMIVDSEILKSGFSFATKSIEINSPTKGVQLMFSSDSIRVNANMEYGILVADGNIIVDSEIEKSLILVSTGTITISEKSKIKEDLICVCDNLELQGEVNGSVIGSVVSANITGNIGKDLRVMSNDVKLNTDKNVKNNIYIETYNKDLNIGENYTNAKIVLKEIEEVNEFSFEKIISVFSACLIFSLIYILVNRVSKKDIFAKFKDKVKENSTWVIVSGATLLLASIPAVFVLIMLSVIGLWVIAVPVLLIYSVFLVVIYILNIFVIGSIMYSYIKEKYLKNGGIGTDILGSFCSFLVLSVLIKIPVIGAYLSLMLYIIASGIVFTIFLKRSK